MPLIGHQRTKNQKAHTAAMGKQRWATKSPTKANRINPKDRRHYSMVRKEVRRAIKKIKKSEYNAQKRERRVKERLSESQAQTQEAVKEADERHEEQTKELRKEKESLKKDIKRLKAHDCREPSKIQHAVQRALKHCNSNTTAQPVVRYVKDKRGVVRDWARNTILTLVNEGIPMSKTWGVTKANANGLGVEIVGRWSS